jgi:hypothetical protein
VTDLDCGQHPFGIEHLRLPSPLLRNRLPAGKAERRLLL